jgi:DNA-directed RNA polymerase subunit L
MSPSESFKILTVWLSLNIDFFIQHPVIDKPFLKMIVEKIKSIIKILTASFEGFSKSCQSLLEVTSC